MAEFCQWSISPFTDDTQVDCVEPDGHIGKAPGDAGVQHRGILRHYAFLGSETTITWLAGDRREFTGNWPGYCTQLGSVGGRQICKLPAEHPGRHAP